MAREGIGNFRSGQLYQAKSWTGLTEESHIDYAWGRQPEILIPTIKHLVDINIPMSFAKWLDSFPTKYISSNQPFKWKLKGYNDRSVPLMGAYTDELGSTAVTSASFAGQNQAFIYLDFPERRFTNTSVIVGELPDYYKLHVQGNPVQVGNAWRYRVKLMTDDYNDFVPADILSVGSYWSVEGGAVERYGSMHGQDISFSTPFDMEERVSILRMEHSEHGQMIDMGVNKPLVFAFTDDEGNTITKWLNYVEWEFIKQFYQRKAEMIFYGNTTVRDDGTAAMTGESGLPIMQGRGLRQQILPTNTHYYNTISLDFLVETALEATYGKVSPENRTFVIQTGEWGLMELSKMIQRELKSGAYQNMPYMQDHTGRAYNWAGGTNGNDLTVKMGQFVGAAVINGINFKFMWAPHYDDLVRNKIRHPNGGYAESHRMTVWDFGSSTEPNVHKVRIAKREPAYGIIPGIRNPYNQGGLRGGKLPANTIATSFDGYTMHILDEEGAVILDPTRVVEFVPSVLRKV